MQANMTINIETDLEFAFWDKHGAREARLAGTDRAMNKRIRFFSEHLLSGQVTFSAILGGEVVGLAGAYYNETPGVLDLCYVSVDERHRGKGVGSQLANALVSCARAGGYRAIACSGYSPLGLTRLRPVLVRLCAEAKVKLRDKAVIQYAD